MKAIIIAAGYGKRLGRYTKETPKALVKINGVSILDRQAELLKTIKIKKILVVIGPNKSKFANKNFNYIKDDFFEKHEQLGSLMEARNQFDDELLILFSDILFDQKILLDINNMKCDIGIGVDLNWEKGYDGRTNHPISQADLVEIKNKEIIKIQKNLNPNVNSTMGEFIGIIKLSKKGAIKFLEHYENLEKNHKGKFQNANSLDKAYLTDIISDLIENHYNITPILVNGNWCEIDTPQDLERAEKLFS